MKEYVEIIDGSLIILDEEMGIDEKTLFNPKFLPNNLKDLPSDAVLTKDKDGKVQQAFFQIDGRREGECKFFYPSGALQGQMYYHQGKLHGPSTFYSENGIILSKSSFYFGGNHGKVKQYYLSGNPFSIQRFCKSKKHGKHEYFYETGAIKTIMEYENDLLNGNVLLKWPDGSKKRECMFIRGQRDGWDIFWSDGGLVLDEGQYKFGDPIGTHIRRFESGEMREELHYHDAKRFDKKEWDVNGRLLFESKYTGNTYMEREWKKDKHEMQERRGVWNGEKIIFSQ